jgi:chromatin remodeling complex protein RSC6
MTSEYKNADVPEEEKSENADVSEEEKLVDVVDEVQEPDVLAQQFSGILDTLGTFKCQITSLQHQVRGLEKVVRKERKAMEKEVKKNRNKGNRKPSGFAKPSKISDTLCEFLGKDTGTEVARTEVTQHIIDYIKMHDLQYPENRKIIKPDKKLKELLCVEDNEEVTYFNLQRYMNKHFPKKTAALVSE